MFRKLLLSILGLVLATTPLLAKATDCMSVATYLPNTTDACHLRGTSFAGMGWSCMSYWQFAKYTQTTPLNECVTMLNSHQAGVNYPWGVNSGIESCTSGSLACVCDYNNGKWSCQKKKS